MDTPDLDSAYALQTPEDNLRLYAAWAETYDSGFADSHHYVLPLRVAEAYVQAGGQAPVIDLGAGTGLCGAALRVLGIAPVEATDLSQQMLDVAARKDIYARLFTGNLLDRLPVEDGAYAGAVSSGTFTHGHVGAQALDEVLRVVRPGGIVALSVNAEHWQAQGFAARFAALGDRIADLATRDLPIYGPGATGPHAGDLSRVVTFTRR
ncbi:class I SAM-dependent DNA methyltransferase [Maliponia aquimaris]|uniref:Biotin biosynthesis protein BioC n=1 Tax=Maliponia aquimaris TaxID=1673631 RepID=A0A238K8Y4_9RHOB|nr:class I SAM-dependent methyltransferase [Maliponia aquimaris]SMX38426.1 biotin biosynthesis protein BioC [Maliponia aquimaris]